MGSCCESYSSPRPAFLIQEAPPDFLEDSSLGHFFHSTDADDQTTSTPPMDTSKPLPFCDLQTETTFLNTHTHRGRVMALLGIFYAGHFLIVLNVFF